MHFVIMIHADININVDDYEVPAVDKAMQKITSMFKGEDIKISIPKEVLRRHWHQLNRRIRMASLLFRNMSRLLPNSLSDGAQKDTLVIK